jgi:hypothetical protein
MVDKSIHNNPQDMAEERLERLKAQVSNISRNMNLLMAALTGKLGSFGDDGDSNSENKSEGKSKYQADSGKELWKESEKEQSS